MKKILMYNGQLYMGGIEKVFISYLKELSKDKNLEIEILIKENDPEKNIFLKEVPENVKVTFIRSREYMEKRERLSLKKKKNIFYKFLYQSYLTYGRVKMRQFIKKYFLENRYDCILDLDTGLRKDINYIKDPLITWCHISFKVLKRKNKKDFIEQLGKYKNIILICDEMKKEFEELYPHLKEKGIRIYNPMDLEKVRERSLEKVNKEDEKLLQNKYMIGVSRLVKEKGREDLIDIYYKLKERGVKEKLYLLGDGPEYSRLKEKIKSMNLEEDVFLLGQKENPYPWVKNAELFVHTSYCEGLPTVLIESLALNTVVVSYDCPTGPDEILKNGDIGELVETGNKIEFENKVFNLLENRDKIEEFKKRIPERVKEFSSEEVIKKLKEIL
ncbi:Glycosyltransferase involved in cell wall bisynthesis [Cetobacterium ceti]|uniref:Glycosyltransferase involved in cell wall bisynthesis n=1 Tax=Cetobacterium ceti TaxID=180163 RepID=A0A1T4LR77_9FUSO|nr:glycosyltransferase [Cetobacterium ceti]SJZ57183.1 Glycosyltransferase involved in cell wall bisynthesis [Cetobacterium ceti]